jgi:hypothetical protein
VSGPSPFARVESDGTAALRAAIVDELARRFPDDGRGQVAGCSWRPARLQVWGGQGGGFAASARAGRCAWTTGGATERDAVEEMARAVGLDGWRAAGGGA